MRYVSKDELKLIDNRVDPGPIYTSLFDFCREKFDKLMNHEIDESDIPELCEHIISEMIYEETEMFFEEQIKEFYRTLFLYIYAPEIQTYELRLMITDPLYHMKTQIEYLRKNNLFDSNIKNIIIELGDKELENINNYIKLEMEIEPKVELPKIKDAYINIDLVFEIIRDFAVNKDLVNEYGDWQPADEKLFENTGGKYNEW